MSFENPTKNEAFTQSIFTANTEISSLIDNVSKVIHGKRNIIEEVVISIIANGHVLLLDVPGVGKTMLAKAISKSIATNFKRIQFTPDLLPSDISGVNIFNPQTRVFEFQQGPVFTNILLADEINRASPKTQSALLEAMEERQVTIDNTRYTLPEFFFVIATKNPLEHAGTYPLPIAQLDRFLMRLTLGYPDRETEKIILNYHTQKINPLDQIAPVVNVKQIAKWQDIATEIYTSPIIDDYLVNLAQASRIESPTGNGVSPRATIMFKKAIRACALINGRDYVIPDDVHRLIKSIYSHRLSESGKVGEAVVEDILNKVGI
jgi:MoxR-like ATPase